MLTIDLGTIEYYDGETNQFMDENIGVVRFEYSLKALYEWEGKWKKPFLEKDHTDEELIDFYKMMAIDPIKDEAITDDVMEKLSKYIADSNTATVFYTYGESDTNDSHRTKIYTAEELYALMINAHVPLDFENRNLNRLLVMLRIIASYNQPPRKMTKEEIFNQNRELNRQRREQYKTKG